MSLYTPRDFSAFLFSAGHTFFLPPEDHSATFFLPATCSIAFPSPYWGGFQICIPHFLLHRVHIMITQSFIPSVMTEAWPPLSSSVRAYVHLNHLLTVPNSFFSSRERSKPLHKLMFLNQKGDGGMLRLEGNHSFKGNTDWFRFYRRKETMKFMVQLFIYLSSCPQNEQNSTQRRKKELSSQTDRCFQSYHTRDLQRNAIQSKMPFQQRNRGKNNQMSKYFQVYIAVNSSLNIK